jgi:phosphate transport system substrate-binding protein
VIGGVVPVVNVPSIKAGEIALDGPTLAGIYLGQIKKWDDAAIKKLNPDVKLPSTAIAVVERSDGSGTTFIFTDYLSKASPDWKKNVGANTSVQWPAGIGAKGNEGVAGQTMQTRGAIGYVEYAFAKQNNMTYVKMINKSGKPVVPTAAAFKAAAANADWTGTPGFRVLLTDQAGDTVWPIAGATFILIPKRPPNPAAAAEALKFFSWAYDKGDTMAEELDYVPLPQTVVAAIRKAWSDNVKDGSGKPVYTP